MASDPRLRGNAWLKVYFGRLLRTWNGVGGGLRRLRVEHAADDVVAHARQVLDAAAADQHDRVLLQVVASPGM